MSSLNRRSFIGGMSLAPCVYALDLPESMAGELKKVRFGLCADVHKDVMHDADQRMKTFVRRMDESQADFICQMGDFCQPIPANKSFLEAFHAFPR